MVRKPNPQQAHLENRFVVLDPTNRANRSGLEDRPPGTGNESNVRRNDAGILQMSVLPERSLPLSTMDAVHDSGGQRSGVRYADPSFTRVDARRFAVIENSHTGPKENALFTPLTMGQHMAVMRPPANERTRENLVSNADGERLGTATHVNPDLHVHTRTSETKVFQNIPTYADSSEGRLMGEDFMLTTRLRDITDEQIHAVRGATEQATNTILEERGGRVEDGIWWSGTNGAFGRRFARSLLLSRRRPDLFLLVPVVFGLGFRVRFQRDVRVILLRFGPCKLSSLPSVSTLDLSSSSSLMKLLSYDPSSSSSSSSSESSSLSSSSRIRSPSGSSDSYSSSAKSSRGLSSGSKRWGALIARPDLVVEAGATGGVESFFVEVEGAGAEGGVFFLGGMTCDGGGYIHRGELRPSLNALFFLVRYYTFSMAAAIRVPVRDVRFRIPVPHVGRHADLRSPQTQARINDLATKVFTAYEIQKMRTYIPDLQFKVEEAPLIQFNMLDTNSSDDVKEKLGRFIAAVYMYDI
eukprot:jgi/Mesvir1/9996/Mv05788-RA.1